MRTGAREGERRMDRIGFWLRSRKTAIGAAGLLLLALGVALGEGFDATAAAARVEAAAKVIGALLGAFGLLAARDADRGDRGQPLPPPPG